MDKCSPMFPLKHHFFPNGSGSNFLLQMLSSQSCPKYIRRAGAEGHGEIQGWRCSQETEADGSDTKYDCPCSRSRGRLKIGLDSLQWVFSLVLIGFSDLPSRFSSSFYFAHICYLYVQLGLCERTLDINLLESQLVYPKMLLLLKSDDEASVRAVDPPIQKLWIKTWAMASISTVSSPPLNPSNRTYKFQWTLDRFELLSEAADAAAIKVSFTLRKDP